MIATNAGQLSPDKGHGGARRSSDRQGALGRMAASAFMKAGKGAEEDSDEEGGNILDQRRINEIFVRLKVAEISSLNFAALGILCGIFDYEIAYNDANDSEKTTRIILEMF